LVVRRRSVEGNGPYGGRRTLTIRRQELFIMVGCVAGDGQNFSGGPAVRRRNVSHRDWDPSARAEILLILAHHHW